MVDKKIEISVSVYKDSLIFAQVVASNKGSSSLYQELLIQKDKKIALCQIKLLPITISFFFFCYIYVWCNKKINLLIARLN